MKYRIFLWSNKKKISATLWSNGESVLILGIVRIYLRKHGEKEGGLIPLFFVVILNFVFVFVEEFDFIVFAFVLHLVL